MYQLKKAAMCNGYENTAEERRNGEESVAGESGLENIAK
jgi:hypothetical protein